MHTHRGSRANTHCQVLIHHAGLYGKQHANGILEIFRRTTLPASGIPAWKPVHKIASRLSRSAEGAGLERDLVALVDDLSTTIASADGKGPMDVSGAISDWYWRVTLLLVLGHVPPGLAEDYRDAWEACIERLGSPLVNGLRAYKYVPTPANLWYRFAAWRFRRAMTSLINADCAAAAARGAGAGGEETNWCVLRIMREDEEMRGLSVEDKLEIAMEFLFTGTTSVTSAISWMLFHLGEQPAWQDAVRAEASRVAAAPHTHGDREGSTGLVVEGVGPRDLGELTWLDACFRETLRLYSPIHVGRRCVTADVAGGYAVPAGADVMTNMWWLHRDEALWPKASVFDPRRFVDAHGATVKPEHYYPFSMGVRGCPGQAVAFMIAKLVAARVLARVRLAPASPGEPAFKPSLMLPNTPVSMMMVVEAVGNEVILDKAGAARVEGSDSGLAKQPPSIASGTWRSSVDVN